jgi:hypothetical protein
MDSALFFSPSHPDSATSAAHPSTTSSFFHLVDPFFASFAFFAAESHSGVSLHVILPHRSDKFQVQL